MYTQEKIHYIVTRQRAFFRTNKTLSISFRLEMLKKLKIGIQTHEKMLLEGLKDDLGRHEQEGYFCDIGPVLHEIDEALHHLKKWAKEETKYSGILAFPSMITKVYKMPYGVSLIMSPFNFPYMLSLGVLVASIAGGNTSVIKASSKCLQSTAALKKMIEDTFEEDYVTVIDGGHDVADMCLNERFDKIFYTGSPKVGKHVMECAAKHLTPVALELGGETGNFCVIRKDANIKDAARKIAWFKCLNSGQVCLNINQVAVAKEVSEEFVSELKKAFEKYLGKHPHQHAEYPKLINEKAYDSLVKELEGYKDRIVFGGKGDRNSQKFDPTVLYPIGIDEDIVQHELFNPLLPIIEYNDAEVDKLLETIAIREHGLSFYLFTRDIAWAKKVMSSQQFGGGCINEVCMQIMAKGAPFNGTGHSGMGKYHGKWGFEEFTHPQTVLIGSTHFNLPFRNHPYKPIKYAILRKLLK